jgi:hypothetical protein
VTGRYINYKCQIDKGCENKQAWTLLKKRP